MTYFPLTPEQHAWQERVAALAAREIGPLAADVLTTCLVVEEIAKHCPSTAMCYKMHLEACELLSRVPTAYQVEHLVKPLAQGEVFATVAGGESAGAGENW